METAGVIYCFLQAVLVYVGVYALPFELNIADTGTAFFMRPSHPWRGNRSVQEWPMVALAGAQSVRASYASVFSHQVELPVPLLRQVVASRGVSISSRLVEGIGDITAHFVTETISSDRRLVQVLFHVRRLANTQPDLSASSSNSGHVCILLYVRHSNGDELPTSCLISDSDVCLAELLLPWRWWDVTINVPRTASAFFSAFHADDSEASASQCDVSRYPPLRRLPADDAATFVHQMALVDSAVTYQTLREDQHVLLRVPTSTYHPGSRFTVTVQLQTDSKLNGFSVKVKCRVGVRVTGIENRNATRWRVNVELNAKRQTATVTAHMLPYNNITTTMSNQQHAENEVLDVFDWVFEVIEADAVRDDTGRLAFTIEYELTGSGNGAGGFRGHVENKVAAKVQIQPDTTFAIIPVVKTTEIVNIAMLTGRPQTYPMTVYAVSHAGRVADVTSQATCHAGNDQVLQVSESCGFVFLDGTETSGSSTASVIVKYNRHARFIHFHVWSPEIPLDVELSDIKLGRVVGWQVPRLGSSAAVSSSNDTLTRNSSVVVESTTASTTTADDIDPCRPLYQSATVEVYARFVTTDTPHGSSPYMLHRKAMFRLTDFVRDRIQLTNSSVARLRSASMAVDGVRPGQTDVQVVSRSGRVLGKSEEPLTVIDETVIISHLDTELVSGIELSLEPKTDFPGAIAAHLTKMKRLFAKHQEALVEVSLLFDDGTTFPLSSLSPTDYQLIVDSSHPDIISVADQSATTVVPAAFPRLVAMATGQGELVRVTMVPNAVCRATSKPSAVKFARVQVDIELVEDPAQSDARVGETATRRSLLDVWGGKERSRGGGTTGSGGGASKAGDARSASKKDATVNHNAELLSSTLHELRRNSPLELAMYILLGVFGIAVAVFAVNCAVFVMRRRRRNRGGAKDGSSSTTDADWIWIGHDALKQNAVGIECTRTLMPDADFGEIRSSTSAGFGAIIGGRVACVGDSSSPPPPPLPPKLGRPTSASLGLIRRGIGGGSRSAANTLQSQVGNGGMRSTSSSMAQDMTGLTPGGVGTTATNGAVMSWHGRSSRSGTTSDIEWECAKLGVTSNDELVAYFDGLRESAA